MCWKWGEDTGAAAQVAIESLEPPSTLATHLKLRMPLLHHPQIAGHLRSAWACSSVDMALRGSRAHGHDTLTLQDRPFHPRGRAPRKQKFMASAGRRMTQEHFDSTCHHMQRKQTATN